MMIDKRLINLCDDSKKYIALTVLMNWISIICNISIIFIIGKSIDLIYKKQSIPLSLYIPIVILALIFRFTSNLYYGKFSYLSSAKARVTLRELIYKKLVSLGSNYSSLISTSSIVQVAIDGVEALEIYFGKYLPQLFYSLLAPITLFIALSFIYFKAALVLILCVPLIPLSIIAIMKIAKKILKNYWNVYMNLGDTFLENLQGLTTLKVFDRDEEHHADMNKAAENFRKITMKVLSMQLNSINLMDFIAFGGAALGSIIAIIQFKQGHISIGSVLIIILLSSEFFIPLRLLGSFFHVAMNGIAASEKIFNLIDLKEENKVDTSEEIESSIINPSVELNNVTFSYDERRNVLKDISLKIPYGSFVALVGESGSGKSTIASILLKTYTPAKGKVMINGVDIKNISFDSISKKIALVSTNSYIFNGTILDNLLMGKATATKEEITSALKLVNLYEFVEILPQKLNTTVGENGSLLSGGQKQRLALARAILSDREIFIFDEATSNIDVESEEHIWNAIYKLAETKTILVISHRLANVEKADNIYVLDKGNLVESGTHDDLYNKNGVYHNMVSKQQALENIGVI